MTSAIVVGSGPNGLAAAARLARAGLTVTVLEASDTIGGGTRSSEMIVPGLVHDHCSAVHPLAARSPYLSTLPLGELGLRWVQPEVDCAHPLDGGGGAALYRSIDRTAAGLGDDGTRWRQVFGPMAEHFDALLADATQPVVRIPRHPIALARFGAGAAMPATVFARLWRTDEARALWSGVAAHAFHRLDRPFSSAVGLMLLVAAHAEGWLVAEGGSQAIADALAADVRAARRRDRDRLPGDVGRGAAAPRRAHARRVTVDRGRHPRRPAPAARRPRVSPLPARAGGVQGRPRDRGRRAVGVGGGARRRDRPPRRRHGRGGGQASCAVHRGRMPERPFVLVGQQYLADRSRSAANINPLWTYAHVPNGYAGDATEAIVAQIERFAPGFRERIVGMAVRSTTEMAVYNPNYVGGDIISGASTPRQLLFRPRVALDPYATGVPGAYLCSASTPPGAGAHGMCGANAAARALGRSRTERRVVVDARTMGPS